MYFFTNMYTFEMLSVMRFYCFKLTSFNSVFLDQF